MTRAGLVLLLFLAACSPAHTAGWWRAHPDAAAAEVDRCRAGQEHDCAAAEQGLADAQRAAREAEFRRAIGDAR